MKNWLEKNYKTLIIAAFLVPIITVAIVSISHVTKWYGISNPVSWSIYLSIGIEIAALSALAAISANMGKKVYFPFAIVTLVQFIGNIYFAYSYIDINAQAFKDWVGLVSPLVEFMGVDPSDFVGHKRFLAFFAGGMLPIISLSFLHMLIKFTEEDRINQSKEESKEETKPVEPTQTIEQLKDFVDETTRLHLSENDLKILEEALLNPPPPNEALVKAAEERKRRGELLKEIMKNDQELGLYDEEPYAGPSIFPKEVEYTDEYSKPLYDNPIPTIVEPQVDLELVEEEPEEDISDWDVTLMDGLEDEPYENPLVKEPSVTPQNAEEMMLTTNDDIIESIPSDDEVSDWDVTLMDGLEEEENIFQEEPTEDEESRNFSIIESETENIFQDNATETLVPEEVISNLLNELIEDVDNQELRTEEQVPELFVMPEEVETFKIDIRAINEILNEVNEVIDIEEDDLKKKDELEVTPSIEIVETPTPTPTPTETQLNRDTDSLYWESGENPIPLVDEESPTQVTYEDNVNESPIEESEQFNPFGSVFPRGGSKIIPRNVRNTKRRGFR